MRSRRWFLTPELIQWRFMCACGDYEGPFFSFPYEAGFIVGDVDFRRRLWIGESSRLNW